MTVTLAEPVGLGPRRAPSRVVFGPHETNLGRLRGISERHAAYYARRARGGAGLIVTETASVHPSDWPYERAPLTSDCAAGWSATAASCHPHGALVLASLGHAGMQGSSAYSQRALWAPARVPDPATREMPMVMEQPEIEALITGFASAAGTAAAAGLDGVEINAGQHSLLRQFHSGLTNLRDDPYGADRLLLTEQVLRAARGALGPDLVLGVRLCCDELAPWAGVTRRWQLNRRPGWPAWPTIWSSCAGPSSPCRRPGPTCMPSLASTWRCAGRSGQPSAEPRQWSSRAAWSIRKRRTVCSATGLPIWSR